jgi:hypothetical protein
MNFTRQLFLNLESHGRHDTQTTLYLVDFLPAVFSLEKKAFLSL